LVADETALQQHGHQRQRQRLADRGPIISRFALRRDVAPMGYVHVG